VRIAIVGTGIAGNAAAWALAGQNPVTVYEKDRRPGGHSHTVDIDYDGIPIAVDTGFIVYNELNYPDLTALFAHLGVVTAPSNMSFSVSADRGRFEWAGGGSGFAETCDGLFAQRSNLTSPSFLWMLGQMLRFNRISLKDRDAGDLAGLSLGDYLARRGIRGRLVQDYLLPMGAAIWSTPTDKMLDFPAENYIAFFDNHRLLHLDRPIWRTVTGGSRNYVEKLTAKFRARLRLGTGIAAIERSPAGVILTDDRGRRETYDQVVIAAHSDQALGMLTDATAQERASLGAIRYRPNTAFLHRDARLMPRRKKAWAAWNFLRWHTGEESPSGAAVTYWMNALQGIDQRYPLFVSLNPPFEPDPALTFARFTCDHPQYDAAAFQAQGRLESIQGVKRTWFCGAWTGYGFHEDGLRSGLAVAEALGARIPWRPAPPALAQAAE
jgi:predicted NAD/FAD-binding protein